MKCAVKPNDGSIKKKMMLKDMFPPCSLVAEGCSTSGLVIWISFHQKGVSSWFILHMVFPFFPMQPNFPMVFLWYLPSFPMFCKKFHPHRWRQRAESCAASSLAVASSSTTCDNVIMLAGCGSDSQVTFQPINLAVWNPEIIWKLMKNDDWISWFERKIISELWIFRIS